VLSIIAAVVLIASNGQDGPPAGVLFSHRALRNARLLIQMRMLELREERLECLREALLRRLPPDLARPTATGTPNPAVKQSGALHATNFRSEDCSWVSTLHKRRRLTG